MLARTNEILQKRLKCFIQFMDHVESWEDSWKLRMKVNIYWNILRHFHPPQRVEARKEVTRRWRDREANHARSLPLSLKKNKHDIDNFSLYMSLMCVTTPDISHILAWRFEVAVEKWKLRKWECHEWCHYFYVNMGITALCFFLLTFISTCLLFMNFWVHVARFLEHIVYFSGHIAHFLVRVAHFSEHIVIF